MGSFWIPLVTVFLIQSSVLVQSSPVAVTSPTVEYSDSPSATEVVFDEAGMESLANGSIDENVGTTEVPDETALSDDEPRTTTSPCQSEYDIEAGLDCSPNKNIPLQQLTETQTTKTDEEALSSDKEEVTTSSPTKET